MPGLLSIGAIDAADPGNDEPQFFSDRGPIEIYFPHRETRNKPDLMGIDGVMITGAGGFGIVNPVSPFSLFYGTSAAAPHVAGIAALVMEAQRKADPSMGKKDVADAVTQKLRDTAMDLGEQDSNGYSNVFGYGLADAWAAITSLAGDVIDTDALELYSLTSYADTHTVNSNGDGADDDTTDGVCDDGTVDGSTNCTLRAAIQQTNAGTGATIKFNISGSGVQTISPASALPAITKPVFIDGYSQPGASAGTVLIELDGTNAGSSVDGLMLQGNGNYVRGLAVNSFSRYGIEISSSRNNVLVGNMVGTDAAGSTDEGNGSSGVHISRSEDVLLRGNVISGNDRNGVETSNGGRLHFYGNKIGTNAAGTADLGNTLAGAHLESRGVVVRDNVISGNDTHGVHLKSNVTQDVVIENNRIGTNDAGTAALANTGSGIYLRRRPQEQLDHWQHHRRQWLPRRKTVRHPRPGQPDRRKLDRRQRQRRGPGQRRLRRTHQRRPRRQHGGGQRHRAQQPRRRDHHGQQLAGQHDLGELHPRQRRPRHRPGRRRRHRQRRGRRGQRPQPPAELPRQPHFRHQG